MAASSSAADADAATTAAAEGPAVANALRSASPDGGGPDVARHSVWYRTLDELKSSTPSRRNGISFEAESVQRTKTCTYMQKVSAQLRLPPLVTATAMLFFHRFYLNYSLSEYDRWIIGVTSLFLAGKVEESPRKLHDVIVCAYEVRYSQKLTDESRIFSLREQTLKHERIILQAIAFDLQVEHPYKTLLKLCKEFASTQANAQTAWNFVNDSLRTTLCLQFKPHVVAVTALFLAYKYNGTELAAGPDGTAWHERYRVARADIDSVANQIIDMYSPAAQQEQPAASPEQIATPAKAAAAPAAAASAAAAHHPPPAQAPLPQPPPMQQPPPMGHGMPPGPPQPPPPYGYGQPGGPPPPPHGVPMMGVYGYPGPGFYPAPPPAGYGYPPYAGYYPMEGQPPVQLGQYPDQHPAAYRPVQGGGAAAAQSQSAQQEAQRRFNPY